MKADATLPLPAIDLRFTLYTGDTASHSWLSQHHPELLNEMILVAKAHAEARLAGKPGNIEALEGGVREFLQEVRTHGG